jgi:hypothetical protein
MNKSEDETTQSIINGVDTFVAGYRSQGYTTEQAISLAAIVATNLTLATILEGIGEISDTLTSIEQDLRRPD